MSIRGRQGSLEPGKSGLESDIHSSTRSPAGGSPQNGGPWPVRRLCLEPQPSGLELWLWGASHYKSRPTETVLPTGGNQIGMEGASNALSEPRCPHLCWASSDSLYSRAWCSEVCAAEKCW